MNLLKRDPNTTTLSGKLPLIKKVILYLHSILNNLLPYQTIYRKSYIHE